MVRHHLAIGVLNLELRANLATQQLHAACHISRPEIWTHMRPPRPHRATAPEEKNNKQRLLENQAPGCCPVSEAIQTPTRATAFLTDMNHCKIQFKVDQEDTTDFGATLAITTEIRCIISAKRPHCPINPNRVLSWQPKGHHCDSIMCHGSSNVVAECGHCLIFSQHLGMMR